MKDLIPRSKAKNLISKNATKFKKEVTMPEIENRRDISDFENPKAVKHLFKSKMKSMKEEKWKNKVLQGQYPKILEKSHPHRYHQQIFVKQFKRRNRGTTCSSSKPGNKYQKLPESNI